MPWQRKSESDVEAGMAQLQSILDTVPNAIVTTDEHGAVELFNTAAERLFDYGADEVIGRNVAMLLTTDDALVHDNHIARYCTTTQHKTTGASRRVTGRRKQGSIIPLQLSVKEATAGGRRVFISFLQDLSTGEEIQARRDKLHAKLLKISRASMVATMATALAHELNQPLTTAANYLQSAAELFARDAEEPRDLICEALQEAAREVLRAGALVNSLREFVTGGRLDRAIVCPRDLALQTCALGMIGGRLRGISCEVTIPPDIARVLVNEVHIQQVLLNLIRNAMEAIDISGAITVTARQDGDMVCIIVEDTGSGIVPGEEEEMFEPFVSSKATGMGLGLAICRTIIEAHGGRLWYEPATTGGAAFHFTLPVAELDDE